MRFALPIGALVVSLVAAVAIAFRFAGGPASTDLARAAWSDGEARFAHAIERAASDPDGAREDFRAAAMRFDDTRAASATAAAAYNAANAWLRAGEVGKAIASYREASLLAPGDARIERNLAEARRQLARSVTPPSPRAIDSIRAVWSGIGAREPVALIGWTLGCALLALSIAAKAAWSRWARRAGITLMVLGALVGTTVALDLAARRSSDLCVIDGPTILRKGNGDGFEQELTEPLPSGAECRALETRPGWVQIELKDLATGWVPERSVIRVR
jgi:tetratricopeptide (TPR) repeat protein